MNISLVVKRPNGKFEQSCVFSDQVKNTNQTITFLLATKPERSALLIVKPATGHIAENFR